MIILYLAGIIYGLGTLWLLRKSDQFREALKQIRDSQVDDVECSYCPTKYLGYDYGEHDEKCPVYIAKKALQ
jgi:hypothetical protein